MPTSAALGAAGEFAASHHGVIPRSQAARLGLTPWNLRKLVERRVLRGPVNGCYLVVGAPPSWHQRVASATLGHRGPCHGSHRTAAALHELEGFACRGLELVVPAGSRSAATGALAHQSRAFDPADFVTVQGIPATGLARTLCDLGDVVDEPVVLRALDDAHRRGTSLRWLHETALRLDRPRRAGPRVLLRLLRPRIDGYRLPDSWFERLLATALTSPILDGLVAQHEIRRPDGSLVARADLAIPRLRLGFEGHSRRYHVGERAERYDEDRDIAAAKLGWELVYLGFAAVRSPEQVRRDMEAIAVRRAIDLGVDLLAVGGPRIR